VTSWEAAEQALLIAVNYAGSRAQGYVQLDLPGLRGREIVLRDLLGDAVYTRWGNDLSRGGLYLDLPAWGYHVFELQAVS
jgi:hypothetical protein